MSSELAPINVILRGEQSGGQIAVMDNAVGAGFPRPPLRHHGSDETFDVLEEDLNFQLDDELFTTESSAWITGVTLDVAGQGHDLRQYRRNREKHH
jgi:hypothetical protein